MKKQLINYRFVNKKLKKFNQRMTKIFKQKKQPNN